MHLPHRTPRRAQPAFMTVERRHAVSIRRVGERYSLVRILRENVDRNISVAKSDAALHHPAGDFVSRGSSANSLQILVDQLIGRRPRGFLRFAAFGLLRL